MSHVECLSKTTKNLWTLCLFKRVVKGGGGGSGSHFTEKKTVLSQFTKNKDIMKITVHGELNIYFSFQGK